MNLTFNTTFKLKNT